MRLDPIRKAQAIVSREFQALYPAPKTLLSPVPPGQFRHSKLRHLKRLVGRWLFPMLQRRNRRLSGLSSVEWAQMITIDHRFLQDWVRRELANHLGTQTGLRVLIPGTHFNTAEARIWFSQPGASVKMLDIVDWRPSFETAEPTLRAWYPADLGMIHGSLDRLPVANDCMDVVESCSVLEHVGNMEKAVSEMARVTKPGGYGIHDFGPLYYSYGGDHAIAAYGWQHGYDHLLLDEEEYQHRLLDESYFKSLGMEAYNSRYWATRGIFSYLKPLDYLRLFQRHFEVVACGVNVSEEALLFRSRHYGKWKLLQEAGVDEETLLVSNISILVRKLNSLSCHRRAEETSGVRSALF